MSMIMIKIMIMILKKRGKRLQYSPSLMCPRGRRLTCEGVVENSSDVFPELVGNRGKLSPPKRLT